MALQRLIQHVHVETMEIGLWFRWYLLTPSCQHQWYLKEASWAAADKGGSSSVVRPI